MQKGTSATIVTHNLATENESNTQNINRQKNQSKLVKPTYSQVHAVTIVQYNQMMDNWKGEHLSTKHSSGWCLALSKHVPLNSYTIISKGSCHLHS